MSEQISYRDLVEARIAGRHPMQIVEAAIGPDRVDDFTSDDVRVREFQRIASEAAGAYPYVGPDWIDVIATQLRSADPTGQAELVAMAQRNRDMYKGAAKMDAGGSFDLWSGILKGLLATRTDQVPPGSPGFVDKPQLV